jgi:DNA-directed RNA polymerase subunit RPC12/RpoP
VCSDCGATFEPATRKTGSVVKDVAPPDPLPDATDPTAACAACDSTAVYLTGDDAAVCGKCGALLEIEMTEVSPG